MRTSLYLGRMDPNTICRRQLFPDPLEPRMPHTLPDSAFKHRSWWSNNPVGHPHSIQCLDAGCRVASVAFSGRAVRFARIKERQRDYIGYFSRLSEELRKVPDEKGEKIFERDEWLSSSQVKGYIASFLSKKSKCSNPSVKKQKAKTAAII